MKKMLMLTLTFVVMNANAWMQDNESNQEDDTQEGDWVNYNQMDNGEYNSGHILDYDSHDKTALFFDQETGEYVHGYVE